MSLVAQYRWGFWIGVGLVLLIVVQACLILDFSPPSPPERLQRAIDSNNLDDFKLVLSSHGDLACRTDFSNESLEHFWPTETVLHLAVRRNRFEMVEELLLRGADPNYPDSIGVTPLVRALSTNNVALIELLLKHGADPNAPSGPFLDTPLHIASGYAHRQSVRVLLRMGALVTSRNRNGDTPLHAAAKSVFATEDIEAVVSQLIEAGASVDAVNNDGKTPCQCLWPERVMPAIKKLLKCDDE